MLHALVLLPFAIAAAVALLPNTARNATAWLAGLTALAGCALLGVAAPAVFAGDVLRASVPWFAGVAFGFRMDGLAFTFALIVCAIGALVVLYARYYLAAEDPPARFFAYLLAFMGAMLGVVLADNLVLLAVFWELTSITSFLLIGFWRYRADARAGARMALAVTGGGGLCLVAGVLLVGHIVGSYDLDRVLAAGPAIRAHSLYAPALVLVLLGAFTKSAQWPFHFWLPNAMAAPTPVSAYLHSATMVKCGVFLLARLWPALGGSDLWFYVVGGTGLVTLAFGAYVAIFQQDLKGLLAYSTISHLGLITLLFGLDTPLAVVAGVFHVLNHAAFKASLFMAAGIVDHETGSRDMRQLNGLWSAMPITATLAMVASGAMAGVPLVNGFLSKEMFFTEALAVDAHRAVEIVVPVVAMVAAAFGVAYSVRFVHDVFFNGQPVGLSRTPHEPPRWMRIPVEVLVVVCLAVGIFPAVTVGPLLAVAAASALHGPLPEYSLALWHGVNLPLAMSVIATVAGTGFYFLLQKALDLHTVPRLPLDGKRVFDAIMAGAQALAERVVRMLPHGSLPRSMAWIVAVAIAAAAWPIAETGFGGASVAQTPGGPDAGVGLIGWIIWSLGIAAALAATLRYRQRLTALVFVGAAGLMVSLAFVLLAAPDLALTQLLVEVVTVVLMMLVLHFLPQTAPPELQGWRKICDAGIALAAGVGIALIVQAVLARPADPISPYYLEHALPAGGGTNVVNVVIVDFRGFDTLGEIAVLGIAALIVHALLAGFRVPASFRPDTPVPGWNPLLVKVVARTLLPLAAMVAVYLLLRGHNLPGGGFIAGLVLASAMILIRVAGGSALPPATRFVHPVAIGAGVLVAGVTGLGSAALGYPFLTSAFGHPVLPVVGEVPLASAALFDLGVFLTVVGATMLTLLSPGVLAAAPAAVARTEGA
ncbi:MAG: monovalent cation/H+ antiporter subunit A [Betaproteobacteria bacterium]